MRLWRCGDDSNVKARYVSLTHCCYGKIDDCIVAEVRLVEVGPEPAQPRALENNGAAGVTKGCLIERLGAESDLQV
jgi:hypothetical protein